MKAPFSTNNTDLELRRRGGGEGGCWGGHCFVGPAGFSLFSADFLFFFFPKIRGPPLDPPLH